MHGPILRCGNMCGGRCGAAVVRETAPPTTLRAGGMTPPARAPACIDLLPRASLYEAQHVKGALPIVATFSQQLTFPSAERLVFLGRQSTPNQPCIRLELHLGLGSNLDPVFCGRDVPDDGTLL